MIDLLAKDCEICKRYRNGESLYRLAFEIKEDDALRKCILNANPLEVPIARLLVWFLDFYEGSRGGDFRICSWDDTDRNTTANDVWKMAWERLRGQCPSPEESWRTTTSCTPKNIPAVKECNRTNFLSKWWCLNSGETGKGDKSGVWKVLAKVLAKAVHTFRNDREIQYGGENHEESEWLSLLLSSDTNERRDFLAIIQWLATGEKPDAIEDNDTLEIIYDACHSQLGNFAWCDWYLMLDGIQATFGIGFDDYPHNNPQDWRRFSINGQEYQIATQPACFVSAPFDRGVDVEYCAGKEGWNTADSKESNHPVFPLRNVPFGIFIRYRAASANDMRRNWWREADKWWKEPPTLGRNQKEILICAREDGVIRDLLVEHSEGIRFTSPEGEERLLSFSFRDATGPSETKSHAKFFCMADRPDNERGQIIFKYKGEEFCRFNVLPKTPELEINGNDRGFEFESPNSKVLAFPGHPIELNIQNPVNGRTYEWHAFFEECPAPVWSAQGTHANLTFRDVLSREESEGPGIHAWCITCRDITDENGGKSIGLAKGLLFPDAIYGALASTHHQCPANWSACQDENPLSDWIAGKTGIRLQYLTESFRVLIPQEKICWWFQKRHERADQTGAICTQEINGRRYFTQDADLPELSASEIGKLDLCRPANPEFDKSTEEWNFLQGYWYCSVCDLIRGMSKGTKFIYNPQAEPLVWKSREGIGFFRFPPMLATKSCLCEDAQGHIGLYVVEGDRCLYDVYAISDKTPDFLLCGKLLKSQCGVGFWNLQDLWSKIGDETIGHDAALCAMPHQDGNTRFWGALSLALPEMCIVRQAGREGGAEFEKTIAPFLTFLKPLADALPETHPIRSMRFWEYEKPPTLEATRLSWELQIQALCDSPDCTKPDGWKQLFSRWRSVGFRPLLEGIGPQLLSSAREGYLRRAVSKPDADIPQDKWLSFVKWLGDYEGTYDTKEFKTQLKALGFRATAKKIGEVKKWKTSINAANAGFRKLVDEVFPAALSLASCRKEWGKFLAREPFHCLALRFAGQLNNNVSTGELSLEAGESPVIQFPEDKHVTPADFVMSIQTGIANDPRKELLVSLLQIMAQPGRRAVRVSGRNEWCETPTDREWLFGLAASLCLLRSGAKPDGWARDILSQILDWLDGCPVETTKARTYFMEYSQMADAILNLPQVRKRLP